MPVFPARAITLPAPAVRSTSVVTPFVGASYNLASFIGNNGWDGSDGTDATGMINFALSEIGPLGPAEIVIPRNIRFTSVGGSAGAQSWILAPLHDGITFRGADRAVQLQIAADAQLSWISGAAKEAGDPLLWFDHTWFGLNADEDNFPRKTIYPVVGPIAQGAESIELDDIGDAANFAVDDYVVLETGQMLGGVGFNNQPHAEIVRVKSISGAVLNLWWPTSAPYVQEYYISGTEGLTSASVTANAAPFGVANINAALIHDIAFENLTIIQEQAQYAFNGGHTRNLTLRNIDFVSEQGYGFDNVALGNIGKRVEGCRIWLRDTNDAWIFAADTGSSYYQFLRNQVWADGQTTVFHVHEGTKHVTIDGNLIVLPSFAADRNHVSVRARQWSTRITNNDFRGGGNTVDIYVDADGKGGGLIQGNTHQKDSGTAVSVQSGAEGWVVDAGDSGGLSLDVAEPNRLQGGAIFISADRFRETTAVSTYDDTSDAYPRWSMVHTAVAQLIASFQLPPEWRAYDAYIVWSNAASSSGNAYFLFRGGETELGEALVLNSVNTGSGASAAPGAANVLTKTKQNSSVIAVDAPGSLHYCAVLRDGTQGTDTLENALEFYGVELRRAA